MFKKRFSFLSVFFAAIILSVNIPAYAEEKEPKSSVANWVDENNDGMIDKEKLSVEEREAADKRTKETHAYLENLAGKKFQAKALEKQLKEKSRVEEVNDIESKISTLNKEVKVLEEDMSKKIGLKEVNGAATTDLISVASSGSSDIKLYGTIYQDIWNPGRYTVKGEWEWITSDWQDDSSSTGNLGKNDGFGVRVDEAIDTYSQSISTYWSYDGTKSNPEFFNTTSNNGLGTKWQDVIRYIGNGSSTKTYNSGYGIMTLSVKFEDPSVGSGDTVEVASRYGHTWNYTGVTGFSISPGSIEINFDSSGYKWSHGLRWPKVL